MPRIRSVHPGQWTDEAFVSLSFSARLLAIALRNEADDQGVFPWRELTLKMRLFPADEVDMSALLRELEDHDLVRSFQANERTFGAIRNFARYQRPRKPTNQHPLPEGLRAYVGFAHAGGDAGEGGGDAQGTHRSDNPSPEEVGVGGERKEEISVPDGTAGCHDPSLNPKSPERRPALGDGLVLKAQVWGPCLDWLAEHSDKPRDRLRPLVGRWCRDSGEAAVLAAMQRAARAAPVDPIAWITKRLKEIGDPLAGWDESEDGGLAPEAGAEPDGGTNGIAGDGIGAAPAPGEA